MTTKKPLLYENGFSATLPSYKAAFEFYTQNKDAVPDGCIMAIPADYSNRVIVRLISAPEPTPQLTGKVTRANACIPDIEPYKSVVDGSIITGRKQHRDHLRAHGKIEVGNEYVKHLNDPQPRQLQGDFNVRPQLREAINKVLNR